MQWVKHLCHYWKHHWTWLLELSWRSRIFLEYKGHDGNMPLEPRFYSQQRRTHKFGTPTTIFLAKLFRHGSVHWQVARVQKLALVPATFWMSGGHHPLRYCKYLKNKRPTWCHLLFYFASYVCNMFQTLIRPSSGTCDYSVELPHWSYCSWFDVCWSFGVVVLEWYPCCRLKSCAAACNTDTTPKLHHTSNQEQYDQCGNSTE